MLDWRSFNDGVTVVLYDCSPPKGRVIACLGRFVSQTCGGITRCKYAQSGAALSHEKCSAPPNSMGYGLNVYRSVREAIAHLVIGCTSVTFNVTRSCGDVLYSYKLQAALTPLLLLLLLLLLLGRFVQKEQTGVYCN